LPIIHCRFTLIAPKTNARIALDHLRGIITLDSGCVLSCFGGVALLTGIQGSKILKLKRILSKKLIVFGLNL